MRRIFALALLVGLSACGNLTPEQTREDPHRC